MSNPPLPLWFDAAPEATFSEPSDCAARAITFEKRIFRRNAIEYGAGVIVMIAFGASAVAAMIKGELFIAAALALTVVGTAIVLWGLHRRASNLERRPEDPCLAHLRRQYQRQYEALRAVPLWYIGPLIPGIVLFYAAVVARVAEVTGWRVALEGVAGSASVAIVIFGLVALANWWAARSLKRDLASIDGLARPTVGL